MFTTFLATLNQANFAGYHDWRLPSVTELSSLVDYDSFAPAIDPVFNTGCEPGCTITTCSCTTIDNYWSLTTVADPSVPNSAWYVGFNYGVVNGQDRTLPGFYARAVRGGS